MGALDTMAVIYSYILSFIIIGIIVISIRATTKFSEMRKAPPPGKVEAAAPSALPAPPVTEAAPEAVARAGPPTTAISVKEKIAAAVTAVATYIATQTPRESGILEVSAPARLVTAGWVYQWRSQASTSFNELSMLKMMRKR